MVQYETGFDLMSKQLEKVLKSKSNNQKAQMDLQNSLLLAKVKGMYEMKMKEAMGVQQFDRQRQLKQTMNPLETEQLNQYKANPEGFSASGKPLGLKGMAERVYMKPQEQWTPSDKQIVGQYQAMTQAGRTTRPTKPVDANLTQKVLAKFIDANKSDEEFALDLKDLKDNKALYEQAGVDVGEVFNQALQHKSTAPHKKNMIQRIWGAITSGE